MNSLAWQYESDRIYSEPRFSVCMYTAKSLGTIVSNAVLVTSNIRLEYSLSMNGDRATYIFLWKLNVRQVLPIEKFRYWKLNPIDSIGNKCLYSIYLIFEVFFIYFFNWVKKLFDNFLVNRNYRIALGY